MGCSCDINTKAGFIFVHEEAKSWRIYEACSQRSYATHDYDRAMTTEIPHGDCNNCNWSTWAACASNVSGIVDILPLSILPLKYKIPYFYNCKLKNNCKKTLPVVDK